MRRLILIGCVLFWAAPASPSPALCRMESEYARGLCAYRGDDLVEAETRFARVAESGKTTPETIKSLYFLGRTKMKLRKWGEAAAIWVKVYTMSKPFYDEWSCDYLLGVCREAAR